MKIWIKNLNRLIFTTLILAICLMLPATRQAAQACASTPDASKGTDSLTINVPISTTYYPWVRILAPDTANNDIYMQIDGGCAVSVGGGTAIPANTWTWVNYQAGDTNSVISQSLTAGSHTILLTGEGVGSGVDIVLLLSDPSCVPTGTDGSNCLTANAPSVSLTSPTSGQSIHGNNFAINASATPNNGGTISSAQLIVNGVLTQALAVSPYSFTLNTLNYNDGSYSLQVTAIDNQSNSSSASSTVQITNGDLNGDGSVGLSDLITVAQNYGKAGSFTYAQGNITGATTSPQVNLSDLIIVAKNYGYNDGLGH